MTASALCFWLISLISRESNISPPFSVMKRLVAVGNTVVVIEHNLDIVLNSDYIIDLGPEGGEIGGVKVFEGTLPELLQNKESHTAEALRRIYKL